MQYEGSRLAARTDDDHISPEHLNIGKALHDFCGGDA